MKRTFTWGLSILILLITTYGISVFAEDHAVKNNMDSNNVKKGISSFSPEPKFTLKNNRFSESSNSRCETIDDKVIKRACKNAFLKEFSNYVFELNHRENVLKWQHLSTQIILFVVLVLVSLGLYFAWVQFHSSNGNIEASEIELSMSGVKVSSPILGVIILTLSLAFFYLYLVYVYPITVI